MATLYDQYGRKVDFGRLKEEQAGPTVAGIRNIYAIEHMAAGITAARLSAILRQAEFGDPYFYLEFCEDIEERELHYLAVLTSRKESIAQLEAIIKPASEDAADQKIADDVREKILESDLDLNLFDMLDALGKGFSVNEIIWEYFQRDGWIPKQVKWRDPRWFMFDWVSGEEILVRSLRSEGGKAIPSSAIEAAPESGAYQAIGIQPATQPLSPFKFITHVSKAKSGLPIRGGLARSAGWAYFFKQYVLKDWMAFCEIYGQPLRTGKYGTGATEQDKDALLHALTSIGTDAAAIFPESMVIEFVEARSAQASAELYEKACTYMDDSVSKAVLGQTLTTQLPKGSGSRAAAQVHEAVRRDILAADAKRLSETITRDLVVPYVQLHYGPQQKYPKFFIGLPDDQDIKVFADVVTEFVDRGLKVGQRQILDKLGLAEAGPDEPLLEPANVIGPGENPEDKNDDGDGGNSALSAAQKKRLARRKLWGRY